MKEFYENSQALPDLFRYECDCIGFPSNLAGEALILVHCDGDCRDEPWLLIRPMRRHDRLKTFEKVSPHEKAKLWSTVAGLLYDGDRLRKIQGMLVPKCSNCVEVGEENTPDQK